MVSGGQPSTGADHGKEEGEKNGKGGGGQQPSHRRQRGDEEADVDDVALQHDLTAEVDAEKGRPVGRSLQQVKAQT